MKHRNRSGMLQQIPKLIYTLTFMVKKILWLCCLVGLSTSANGQAMSLKNLISMQKGGLAIMSNILLEKAWIFNGEDSTSLRPDNGCDFKELKWVFSPSDSEGNRAQAHMRLFKDSDCENVVTYGTTNSSIYRALKSDITRNRMKLVHTGVIQALKGNPGIAELYRGANYQAQIVVTSTKTSSGKLISSYQIMLMLKQGT